MGSQGGLLKTLILNRGLLYVMIGELSVGLPLGSEQNWSRIDQRLLNQIVT